MFLGTAPASETPQGRILSTKHRGRSKQPANGDRANNWQEWQSATVPTNALSALRLLTPQIVGTNLAVSWESVSGKSYFLERSTGLHTNASFLPLASGIAGQAGTTTFTDTNPASAGPRFYHVGVE